MYNTRGVSQNRGTFVKVAAQKSTTEADALFCVYTAALMNQINEKTPIARIVMLHDFPICAAKDGTIILAVQWDYAAWTLGASQFTSDVQKFAAQSGENKRHPCGSFGARINATARGIGKPQHHRAEPARSRTAEVIRTCDRRL
jgi:hypothetical protein